MERMAKDVTYLIVSIRYNKKSTDRLLVHEYVRQEDISRSRSMPHNGREAKGEGRKGCTYSESDAGGFAAMRRVFGLMSMVTEMMVCMKVKCSEWRLGDGG